MKSETLITPSESPEISRQLAEEGIGFMALQDNVRYNQADAIQTAFGRIFPLKISLEQINIPNVNLVEKARETTVQWLEYRAILKELVVSNPELKDLIITDSVKLKRMGLLGDSDTVTDPPFTRLDVMFDETSGEFKIVDVNCLPLGISVLLAIEAKKSNSQIVGSLVEELIRLQPDIVKKGLHILTKDSHPANGQHVFLAKTLSENGIPCTWGSHPPDNAIILNRDTDQSINSFDSIMGTNSALFEPKAWLAILWQAGFKRNLFESYLIKSENWWDRDVLMFNEDGSLRWREFSTTALERLKESKIDPFWVKPSAGSGSKNITKLDRLTRGASAVKWKRPNQLSVISRHVPSIKGLKGSVRFGIFIIGDKLLGIECLQTPDSVKAHGASSTIFSTITI